MCVFVCVCVRACVRACMCVYACVRRNACGDVQELKRLYCKCMCMRDCKCVGVTSTPQKTCIHTLGATTRPETSPPVRGLLMNSAHAGVRGGVRGRQGHPTLLWLAAEQFG